ncbi:MAG: tRNA (guanine(46)-N(7))-methyltransferase TrmB [Paracoccaceae bacterium]
MSDDHLHPKTGKPRRNFYGRRVGKTMNAIMHTYLKEDLAALSPGLIDWEENPDREILDVKKRFKNKPIWLEIGFGSGEHLVHQAALNPEIEFIGCEPFINGVATLLGKIREAGVENIAIYPGDARDLFDVLPPNSLDRAYLLYPDPWPKKRHFVRRFVNQTHLVPLCKALKAGSIFRVATDIPDYVRQTLEEVPKAGFHWTAETPSDWRSPWDDWHSTRYEQKALRENRTPHYLTFVKD